MPDQVCCQFCGVVGDGAEIADHQWTTHAAAECCCRHVEVEHDLDGGCRRCGCAAFKARVTVGQALDQTPAAGSCAVLQARLNAVGGTLSAACVNHVWSVVLTRDRVVLATARDRDLFTALARAVTMIDEVDRD